MNEEIRAILNEMKGDIEEATGYGELNEWLESIAEHIQDIENLLNK